MENLDDVALHLQRFSWPDYVFFCFMLFLCILIGLYFGFVKKHDSNAAAEYLVGNRSMHFFPISLSLIARYEEKIVKYFVVRCKKFKWGWFEGDVKKL